MELVIARDRGVDWGSDAPDVLDDRRDRRAHFSLRPPLLRFCINRDRRQREDEEPTGVERPGEGEEVVAG
jgi:hypothetical protein